MADVAGDEIVERWGVWLPLRVATLLVAVAFGGFALTFAVVAATADGTEIVEWSVLALVVAAIGVGTFRVGVWPALIARRDGLVVRNPVRWHVVPWDDIERLEPGYTGIVVVRRDGRPVTAFAVQKSNAAAATGATTRADRVIAALEGIAARYEGTGERQLAPSPERRDALARSARRVIVVGAAGIVLATVIRLLVA